MQDKDFDNAYKSLCYWDDILKDQKAKLLVWEASLEARENRANFKIVEGGLH